MRRVAGSITKSVRALGRQSAETANISWRNEASSAVAGRVLTTPRLGPLTFPSDGRSQTAHPQAAGGRPRQNDSTEHR